MRLRPSPIVRACNARFGLKTPQAFLYSNSQVHRMSDTDTLGVLRQNALFEALDSAELDPLLEEIPVSEIPGGQVILSGGMQVARATASSAPSSRRRSADRPARDKSFANPCR